MNIRLTFVALVVSLIFLGYMVLSGNYKISELNKPPPVVESNLTPLQVFMDYVAVVSEAKDGKELLPYHPANFVKENKYNYESMDDFLEQEKRLSTLKNIKILSDNMKLTEPVKKLEYLAWHVPSRNRITGVITFGKERGHWVILSHSNEFSEKSRRWRKSR